MFRLFFGARAGLKGLRRLVNVQETGPTSAGPAALRKGDKVQYFSTSYACWMDTTIASIDSNGAMELQCKPGALISWEFQAF